MEALVCSIRENNIKGLDVPGNNGKDVKTSVYMDDLTLFLTKNDLLCIDNRGHIHKDS